ncbi:hypothetical protein PJV89_05430 [Aliarcobacter butzleri]|uniref:hypothetical protein n=1 Tax=Aliarcobacter butzleri TaxID=28197 RepID=UPI00263C1F48|nr:hypothetical protein [Aliarcobacter butzleri]MDN5077615.1 hypothetical protein [Aliarcobacter butzleri]MDN5118837.1 hypothetical protein [Aliarcobacter butzleri]
MLEAIKILENLKNSLIRNEGILNLDVDYSYVENIKKAIEELEALETKDKLAELEKVILDYYLDKGYKIGTDGLGFKVNITTLYQWKLMHVIFLNPKRELVFQIITETTKEMFDKAFEHFGVNREENTIDDDLHCPKCKSKNVSCACFGENDGCNCRDCNHSFMIHD